MERGWNQRNALRRKRQCLGLTYEMLGRFLGVHWSTCRRWETRDPGERLDARRLCLGEFLSGAYDDYVHPLLEVCPRERGLISLPKVIGQAVSKIWPVPEGSVDAEKLKKSLGILCKQARLKYIATVFHP